MEVHFMILVAGGWCVAAFCGWKLFLGADDRLLIIGALRATGRAIRDE